MTVGASFDAVFIQAQRVVEADRDPLTSYTHFALIWKENVRHRFFFQRLAKLRGQAGYPKNLARAALPACAHARRRQSDTSAPLSSSARWD